MVSPSASNAASTSTFDSERWELNWCRLASFKRCRQYHGFYQSRAMQKYSSVITDNRGAHHKRLRFHPPIDEALMEEDKKWQDLYIRLFSFTITLRKLEFVVKVWKMYDHCLQSVKSDIFNNAFSGYLSLREKVDLKSNCNGWVGCEGIYLFCVTVIAKRGMWTPRGTWQSKRKLLGILLGKNVGNESDSIEFQ